jgi:hypothetical protein
MPYAISIAKQGDRGVGQIFGRKIERIVIKFTWQFCQINDTNIKYKIRD